MRLWALLVVFYLPTVAKAAEEVYVCEIIQPSEFNSDPLNSVDKIVIDSDARTITLHDTATDRVERYGGEENAIFRLGENLTQGAGITFGVPWAFTKSGEGVAFSAPTIFPVTSHFWLCDR